ENFDEAVEKLGWYAKRWGIEVYHRTLKSGCKIEQRQLGSADRLEACLAIDMVVAWRIFHLTKLGRQTPDVLCSVFFDEAEWKALYCFVRQDPKPPDQPPTLREATRMVASLGGFLGRKSDGEPGTKSLWLGIQRLDDIAATWKFMALNFAPHLLSPPVSSKPGYGSRSICKRGAMGDFRSHRRFHFFEKIPLNPPFGKGGNFCLCFHSLITRSLLRGLDFL